MPPGIVKTKNTKYDRDCRLDRDIRLSEPKDSIAIRRKISSRQNNRAHQTATKVHSLMSKESVKFGKGSKQVAEKKDDEQLAMEEVQKNLMEVAYDRQPASNVDFEHLYKDKLPEDAIELQEYVKSIKENKDIDEDIVKEAVKQGHIMLDMIMKIVPDGKSLPAFLQASDVLPENPKYKNFSFENL